MSADKFNERQEPRAEADHSAEKSSKAAGTPDKVVLESLKLLEDRGRSDIGSARDLNNKKATALESHTGDLTFSGSAKTVLSDISNAKVVDGKLVAVDKQPDGGVLQVPFFNTDTIYKDAKGNSIDKSGDVDLTNGDKVTMNQHAVTEQNSDQLIVHLDGSTTAILDGNTYYKASNGSWAKLEKH